MRTSQDFRERITNPNQQEPAHVCDANIKKRQSHFAIAQERECLQAKRRESCKAAEQSDQHHRAQSWVNQKTIKHQIEKQTGEEATNQVHYERAGGKRFPKPFCNRLRNPISQQRANRTRKPDVD